MFTVISPEAFLQTAESPATEALVVRKYVVPSTSRVPAGAVVPIPTLPPIITIILAFATVCETLESRLIPTEFVAVA